MCGIAGLFHCGTIKPVDPLRVERMTGVLAHRGPDGAGVWTGPGVGLGHRRLSVIDVEGSPQPMASFSGRSIVIFNGEIYNYRELRRELTEYGATFQTEGDTEVILEAWERWGPDCVRRLNGMFAFAIYDQGRRELFLARDRLGVKPLFYCELSDGSVAFASELKGLLAHPLMRREVDPKAIEDYLAWGYVPDHRSILRGVKKLPAGHTLTLRHDGGVPEPQQYWDVSFAERSAAKPRDLEAELLHHLQEAVTSRMVADVPLGAFLSGGVDSSTVVAFMAEASRRPVSTFSIGFDVAEADETSHAEKVAALFGTDHSAHTVSADQFDAIDTVAGMFDEPFADASALPTWRVCQLARENVTIALSGDGADEAMAGYRRQVFHHREEQARRLIPNAVREKVLGPLGRVYPKADWAPRPLRAKTTLQSLAGSGAHGYARALAVVPSEWRGALYSNAFAAQLGEYRAEDPFVELMAKAPARSGLDRAQYADLKFWLPGDILTKVDRTSMAVSLEAREPLLDHRLVEFAACLPEGLRVKGMQGKWLLKTAMGRYLPNDILYRPKQGFVTPVSEWLRGPLAGKARGIAKSAMLARTGWFDNARLAELAEAHIAGRSDHGRLLWQLVMLDRSLARLGIT
ncbi:XrtA/PEP-CTERM system amidotransferase [Aurantiacibacter gangjinensis]|uniref:asparagine synthase (glutamine-hydrolyzing) n=1 Tax=Aurantiacibacter gangjinensis TaxID=502682 RepID=A0A0G9MQJ1_9SPHN|nr:XrtA/PEP-CTERM system amidotransferase [Aurantiacibacter gangjinensis]APE28865.1 Asparagine synthetase [glutamine-hydrolyzing] AsnH [Aurantiacibacter gangjinensis]KLE33001.1 asparagine synthase [Aurantiacibacter gangjinensis]